jgi:trehalose 6-phosphate synthase
VRGFQAYERLLEDHPDLKEKVTFLALLVPSREGLEEYQEYAAQVRGAIDHVNQRFGTKGWRPIEAIFGNDHPRALACMEHYDVLLVNPLADGMNLVVKEGGLLNRRDGAIVLSTSTGAYEQLHDGVLGIDPQDVDATSAALHQALTMRAGARAELASRVRSILLQEDAGRWLSRQYNDLFHYTVSRRRQSVPKLISFFVHRRSAEEPGPYRPAKTEPLADRRQISASIDLPSSLFSHMADSDDYEIGS